MPATKPTQTVIVQTPTSTYRVIATPCVSGKFILSDSRGKTQVSSPEEWATILEILTERGGKLTTAGE